MKFLMIVSPSVFRVLPASIHGISHIPELVTTYLLPHTIDAAVYMDLRIVVRVYGDFLSWTVAAMDGAASRGRLDICRFLQFTRTEGCSAVAFTGAVMNSHVDCLQWLIEFYPDLYDPEKCLNTAVVDGQNDLVRYLNQRMGNYVKTPYLEIAAASGDLRVLEALQPWADDPDLARPLHQAFLHSQEEVYNLFIETFTSDEAQWLNNVSLDIAVMRGKAKMVKLLLKKGAMIAENRGTLYAAENGHLDVMEILLQECKLPPPGIFSSALDLAALNDHYAVVECLLKHFAGQEEEAKGGQIITSSIANAFRAAVGRGSINMVKVLVARCPDDILGQGLQEAGITGKLELAKLLLSECERRHLNDSVYIAAVVQKAAECGDLEMAKLLVHKCLPPTAGVALLSAVANKDLAMLELFAPINGVYQAEDPYKLRALARTAEDDQVEMVEILVQHCDQRTIESTVAMIPTTSTAVFNLLLEKFNSDARKRIFSNLAAKGSINLAGQLLGEMDTESLRWALMSAASNGHLDTVEMLLSKTDTMSVDCALEVAAINGALDVVELLRGRCSSRGCSDAISSASANGHEEIVQVLRSKCRRISGDE
ncbi:putative ankyrin repeat protein [Phytophthora citrophthora]|uniref:Ankyrin repeat protein n=1 Tax=Phytophthora citrophthora TaxID=4793 RepID=A0AAD9LAP8_9STRA|nr:putative ankyrin repeat protein [Phytophthora citrophthora]